MGMMMQIMPSTETHYCRIWEIKNSYRTVIMAILIYFINLRVSARLLICALRAKSIRLSSFRKVGSLRNLNSKCARRGRGRQKMAPPRAGLGRASASSTKTKRRDKGKLKTRGGKGVTTRAQLHAQAVT